jgi:ribosomal protein L11 methylase PrmA
VVQHIRPGGVIVLSGIIEEQAPAILTAMEQNQVSLIKRQQVRDWVTLIGQC